MKLDLKQKEVKQVVSYRLTPNTIKLIKNLAKENKSSESVVVEYLIHQGVKEQK
ncbi:MAG: hypothetical protein LBL60_01795 [Mycoplasmataceae bacterium]|jgi:hypothetical protein|nr:hypothetical protein [Mycoplasmataceae bacterium]